MWQARERDWKLEIKRKGENCAPLMAICGPSGVGKTTIARILSRRYPVYIESTKGNPYLNRLLVGRRDFDAAANQRWFLNQISGHIKRANRKLPLILDQDPAAIVLAYAKMFFEDHHISEIDYDRLLDRLMRVEIQLREWKHPRYALFLDAPAATLYERVLRRQGPAKTPPLKWFVRVRREFINLVRYFPNAIKISTVKYRPKEIARQAERLIGNALNS